jgi:hypothetical protein
MTASSPIVSLAVTLILAASGLFSLHLVIRRAVAAEIPDAARNPDGTSEK